MNFEELIRARQSCREFSDREVPQEDILACLGAARLSPSACNAQPYHITVCTGSVARETAACLQSAGINKFTSNVPCFFVISEAPYNIADAGASLLKDQDFRGMI
jgi:nitroreductase